MRHPEEAATLIGAGEVWRETFGFPRPLGFQPSFEQDLQLTRRQLSPPAFDAAYGRGRRMSTAQAETALADAIDDLTALASPAPAGLTAREVEVLRLVASGLSNADIADRLVVSPRTVHAHLRSVFDKLGVATRTAAAREAVRLNLS
jgi:DNA-binding CsgD family transcriptional regulator